MNQEEIKSHLSVDHLSSQDDDCSDQPVNGVAVEEQEQSRKISGEKASQKLEPIAQRIGNLNNQEPEPILQLSTDLVRQE